MKGSSRRWRYKPPVGTPIDPDHPIARTLFMEFLPHNIQAWRGHGGNVWTPENVTDGSTTMVSGQTGRALDISTFARSMSSSTVACPAAAATIAMIIYPKSAVSNTAIVAAMTATAAEYMAIRTPHADGNIYLNFGGSGAGQLGVACPAGFANAWHRMVFRAGPSGSSIWHDGSRIANQTTAVSRTAKKGVTIGSWPEIGYSDITGFRTEGIWGDAREWTDSEIREWTAMPYAMYEPSPTLRVFAPVAAGPGGAKVPPHVFQSYPVGAF